jgi:hypothetical protein
LLKRARIISNRATATRVVGSAPVSQPFEHDWPYLSSRVQSRRMKMHIECTHARLSGLNTTALILKELGAAR